MDFKLDRTKFKMYKLEDAPKAIDYWKDKSMEERLAAAEYLNSIAYNYPLGNPPRLDRTKFSMRKFK